MSSPAGADPTHFANLKQRAHFQTYTLGAAYDEMLDHNGTVREQYAVLLDRLQSVDPAELKQRQSAAELAFLAGVAFAIVVLPFFWWGGAVWSGASLVALAPHRGMAACVILAVGLQTLLIGLGGPAMWRDPSNTDLIFFCTMNIAWCNVPHGL